MADVKYDERFGKESKIISSDDGKTLRGEWYPSGDYDYKWLVGDHYAREEAEDIELTVHGKEVPNLENTERYKNNDGIRRIVLNLPDAVQIHGNFHFQIYCEELYINAPKVNSVDEKAFRFCGGYNPHFRIKVILPRVRKLHSTFQDCGMTEFEGEYPHVDSALRVFYDCPRLKRVRLSLPNCKTCKNLFDSCNSIESAVIRTAVATEYYFGCGFYPWGEDSATRYFYVRKLNKSGKITNIDWYRPNMKFDALGYPSELKQGSNNIPIFFDSIKKYKGTLLYPFAFAAFKDIYAKESYMRLLAEYATDITSFNIV